MSKNKVRTSQLNTPNLEYQKIHESSELPFAAFLKCRGLSLVGVKKNSNGRVSWAFDLDGHDESTLAHEYHTSGLVEAAKFFSELRSLKAMTYTA